MGSSAAVQVTEIMLISAAWSKLFTALATAVRLVALHFWSRISADRTQLVKMTDSLLGKCPAAPSAVPGES
jgi:hypothetical protein